MCSSAPEQTSVVCDIIVAEGFVLTELAGVVDVLRLANRVSGRQIFDWCYRSLRGGHCGSSAGAVVDTDRITEKSSATYVFVLGNADPTHPHLALGPIISTYIWRQARVILLAEAASRYIAEQRNNCAKHTTHWENRTVLQEQGMFETRAALVSDEGPVITCAGMGATVDVTLSIVAKTVSPAAMTMVADILLHERVRHFQTLQPYAGRARRVTGDLDVDTCIAQMQDHIEEPLTIAEIVADLDISQRSLERKFHTHLGRSPNAYYRQLRLTKANNLLLNTQMPIHEVGLACGFPSGFSGIYKQSFGKTPRDARNRGRLQ